MNILITSGGTEEPIDGVRSITNFSTGRTGAFLAEKLNDLGATVTLLYGKRAVKPSGKIRKATFSSFRDLHGKMKYLLKTGEFHGVIHLAAVSDFSLDHIRTENGSVLKPRGKGKLPSHGSLTLHMKRNPKILERIKSYAPENRIPLVVGFKLTNTISMGEMQNAVRTILNRGGIDILVHNNLPEITKEKHPAAIYSPSGRILHRTKTKEEIAHALFFLMEKEISPW